MSHDKVCDLLSCLSEVRQELMKRLMSSLSHVQNGLANMVDVGSKQATHRFAKAMCSINFPKGILDGLIETDISSNRVEIHSKKGPIVNTAIIAGVLAAKKTADLIPLCHPLPLNKCDVHIMPDPKNSDTLLVTCEVSTFANTGVEMEALVGASNSALCVYDMCKALTHDIQIDGLHLISKTGGKRDFFKET
jgi:cyclic pyranopterin monophosphate synthase